MLFRSKNTDEFKMMLPLLTNEQLEETKETMEQMIKEYERSGVPSAKEQIAILQEKCQSCIDKLESNAEELEKPNTENVDSDNTKSKGKGKEKEE